MEALDPEVMVGVTERGELRAISEEAGTRVLAALDSLSSESSQSSHSS